MADTLITVHARPPGGRSDEGSLKDAARVMGVQCARSATLSASEPPEIVRLIMGEGKHAGESNFNIAWVGTAPTDTKVVPGGAVNWWCAVNLQRIGIRRPPGMPAVPAACAMVNSQVNHSQQFGLETICVISGQGTATLERLS
ncbi:hypothetical protein [Nocardia sp. NPDC003183]